MKEDYHKWHSLYLNREFEMLVFGHGGFPVIFFPTAGARYYEAKDRGLINSVHHFIESGRIKIYCPDSADYLCWYNYSAPPAERAMTYTHFESAIMHEVLEFALHETGAERVGAAGAGFGGYHAVNIALKHPDKVGMILSMDGNFNIKPHIWGYYDDNCYFNNPPDYLPNLTDQWYLSRIREMKILIEAGTGSPSLEENRNLSRIFSEKDIRHKLEIKNEANGHWPGWCRLFPEYISCLIG